jgi:hypothetical protein
MFKKIILRYVLLFICFVFTHPVYSDQEQEDFLLKLTGIWQEQTQDCSTTMQFDYPNKIYIKTNIAEASGTFSLSPMSHQGKRYYLLYIKLTKSNGVRICDGTEFEVGNMPTFNLFSVNENEFNLDRSMKFVRIK